jgi:hypothetical protein
MDDRNLYGRAIEPDKRGRHKTFSSAIGAAFSDLTVERNAFFDSLADNWRRLFPDQPARPGRYQDGHLFIYVRTSGQLFALRPKLPKIKKAILPLRAGDPNAPKRLTLHLEIHSNLA